jgi:hypothetical protein
MCFYLCFHIKNTFFSCTIQKSPIFATLNKMIVDYHAGAAETAQRHIRGAFLMPCTDIET